MAVTGGRWPMHTSLPLSFYMSRGFEFLQVGREGGEAHPNDDGMIGSERDSLQGTSTYVHRNERNGKGSGKAPHSCRTCSVHVIVSS